MTEAIKAKFKVENEENRIGIIDETDIDYICSIGTEQQMYEHTFTLNEIHEAIEKGIIKLEDAKGVICSVKIHKGTFDFDILDTVSNTFHKNIKKTTLFAFQSELTDEASFEGKIELSLLVVTGGGDYAIKQNNTIVSIFDTPKEAYQKAEEMHTKTGLFYEVVALA